MNLVFPTSHFNFKDSNAIMKHVKGFKGKKEKFNTNPRQFLAFLFCNIHFQNYFYHEMTELMNTNRHRQLRRREQVYLTTEPFLLAVLQVHLLQLCFSVEQDELVAHQLEHCALEQQERLWQAEEAVPPILPLPVLQVLPPTHPTIAKYISDMSTMLHGHDNFEIDTIRGHMENFKNTHNRCARQSCRTRFGHDTTP